MISTAEALEAEIDENGKCALFKEGENEFYKHTSNATVEVRASKVEACRRYRKNNY